jgi:hypothetical protein
MKAREHAMKEKGGAGRFEPFFLDDCHIDLLIVDRKSNRKT